MAYQDPHRWLELQNRPYASLNWLRHMVARDTADRIFGADMAVSAIAEILISQPELTKEARTALGHILDAVKEVLRDPEDKHNAYRCEKVYLAARSSSWWILD